jgi:hypothetical protein
LGATVLFDQVACHADELGALAWKQEGERVSACGYSVLMTSRPS